MVRFDAMPLEREEHIEQAHFFRALRERMQQNMATQDLLAAIREEILATTKLPMALDFLLSELKLTGVFAPAMARLSHYFTPFQTYIIAEAEDDRGRFDFAVGLEILERDAKYRSGQFSRQGVFLFQFEVLCRNRLRYDPGLAAMAVDPIYDEAWHDWILTVRRQIGVVDFADLVYVRSEHYAVQAAQRGCGTDAAVLFGLQEGKIALANRRKDPLLLFAAMQRQLNYPAIPRPEQVNDAVLILPQLVRRMERLESRLKLVEEEQRGGIDLARFYGPPPVEDIDIDTPPHDG